MPAVPQELRQPRVVHSIGAQRMVSSSVTAPRSSSLKLLNHSQAPFVLPGQRLSPCTNVTDNSRIIVERLTLSPQLPSANAESSGLVLRRRSCPSTATMGCRSVSPSVKHMFTTRQISVPTKLDTVHVERSSSPVWRGVRHVSRQSSSLERRSVACMPLPHGECRIVAQSSAQSRYELSTEASLPQSPGPSVATRAESPPCTIQLRQTLLHEVGSSSSLLTAKDLGDVLNRSAWSIRRSPQLLTRSSISLTDYPHGKAPNSSVRTTLPVTSMSNIVIRNSYRSSNLPTELEGVATMQNSNSHKTLPRKADALPKDVDIQPVDDVKLAAPSKLMGFSLSGTQSSHWQQGLPVNVRAKVVSGGA